MKIGIILLFIPLMILTIILLLWAVDMPERGFGPIILMWMSPLIFLAYIFGIRFFKDGKTIEMVKGGIFMSIVNAMSTYFFAFLGVISFFMIIGWGVFGLWLCRAGLIDSKDENLKSHRSTFIIFLSFGVLVFLGFILYLLMFTGLVTFVFLIISIIPVLAILEAISEQWYPKYAFIKTINTEKVKQNN